MKLNQSIRVRHGIDVVVPRQCSLCGWTRRRPITIETEFRDLRGDLQETTRDGFHGLKVIEHVSKKP